MSIVKVKLVLLKSHGKLSWISIVKVKWMKACEVVDSLDKKVAIQNVTGSPTV